MERVNLIALLRRIDSGPACDANQGPSGASTLGIKRPKSANSIPYGGVGIFHCTVSLSKYQN